jgi:hypothetical protein
MLETPKQDFHLYDALCRRAHAKRLRALTPESALALYEELFTLSRSGEAHASRALA